MNNMENKPPIGLMPKYIWQEKRYKDICEAIKRYKNVNKKIPKEWIEEYIELWEIIGN